MTMEALKKVLKKFMGSYQGLDRYIWQGIIVSLIQSIASGMIFFLSLYFVNNLKLNIQTSSLLITVYGIGTIFGGIVSGKLSDRISPKYISIVCLILQAVVFYSLTRIENFELLTANLFILGVAVYSFMTANNVWMLSLCFHPETRLKYLNLARVASNLGMSVSGFIIARFLGFGFKNIFFVIFVGLFLSGIFLAISAKRKININYPENESSLSRCQGTQNKKMMSIMLVCLFLAGLIIAQLSSTYPVYVENFFGIKILSTLFILDTVLIVLFQAPLINLLGGCNKTLLVGWGVFLMGLGLVVLGYSALFTIAILSCVIFTVGEMIFVTMVQFVYYENASTDNKGSQMGLFNALAASARVIGPIAGGSIYQHYSGEILWYLNGAMGLCCLMICYFYRNHFIQNV